MDRVQQRLSFLSNAFLSGLWSRTLVFLEEGGLRPVQGSTASSSSSVSRSPTDWLNSEDKAFQWVFRTFSLSNARKCEGHPALECESASERPHDFSDDGNIFREDEEKIWIRLDTGQWKLLCTDLVVDQPWS